MSFCELSSTEDGQDNLLIIVQSNIFISPGRGFDLIYLVLSDSSFPGIFLSGPNQVK